MEKFSSIAGVVNALGDKAVPNSMCMVCMRTEVTVYPLLSLMACATCIVIQSGGTRD